MKLYRKSRNLIPFPYNGTTNKRGITFTANTDGSFLVNGKNDGVANSFYYLILGGHALKAGTYTLSIHASDSKINATMLLGGRYYTALYNKKFTFTLEQDGSVERLYLQVNQGQTKTFENERVTIMLNEGETALPYEPYAGQRIKLLYGSKNLIPFPTSGQYFEGKSSINNGITYTVGKDGLISIKGKIPDDATQKYSFYIFAGHDLKNPLLAEIGTYTISAEVVSGTLSGREFVEVRNLKTDGTSVQLVKCNIASEVEGRTFNIANGKIQRLSVLVEGIGTEVDCTFRIMLNKGETALPYEKYFPLSKMNLFLKSRNLIPYPYAETTTIKNGVTFTDNGDGSITINGTATAKTSFILKVTSYANGLKLSGTYTFTFKNAYSDNNRLGIRGTISIYENGSNKWLRADPSVSYTFNGNESIYELLITVDEGITANNLTIYPMLNAGEVALPFEPPQEYPN